MKLMTNNGFGILLIFDETKLKRDIAQHGKIFNEPPVGFGNNKRIDMKTKEEES